METKEEAIKHIIKEKMYQNKLYNNGCLIHEHTTKNKEFLTIIFLFRTSQILDRVLVNVSKINTFDAAEIKTPQRTKAALHVHAQR